MAVAGDVYANPVTGERCVVRVGLRAGDRCDAGDPGTVRECPGHAARLVERRRRRGPRARRGARRRGGPARPYPQHRALVVEHPVAA